MARIVEAVRRGSIHRVITELIASVDWRRPEILGSMCISISTTVLLLGWTIGRTGWILKSDISPINFATMRMNLTV